VKIYRISFVKNAALTCKVVTDEPSFIGAYHYEHKQGNLIYAIIKAENEDNAITVANFIVKEVSEKRLTL